MCLIGTCVLYVKRVMVFDLSVYMELHLLALSCVASRQFCWNFKTRMGLGHVGPATPLPPRHAQQNLAHLPGGCN